MALYKDAKYLRHDNGTAFDAIHSPGGQTPLSGIYKCEGCGHEITSVEGHPFPPQNHHQHNHFQGYIRWRLIVATWHQ